MTFYRQISLLLTTVAFVLAQLFIPAGAAIAQSLDYRDSSTGVSINLETGEVKAEKAQDISEETVKEISGSRFDDVLIGNGLDNTLRGLDGDDEIYGKAGNDFLFGEVGADLLDGGEGADLIGYLRSREGVTINLETNTASGGDAEGDTIRSIEKVDGSRLSDVLTGNESSNTLRGFDGDDEIYGEAGNDFLFGEVGADLLDGGEGADLIGYLRSPEGVTINLEADTASGGDAEGDTIRSIEKVDGSRLSDVLTGNESSNTLRGFDGDDEIYGKAGNDFLFGERGADLLDGGEGADLIGYIRSPEGVTINLETNTVSGGDAEGDIIRSIESVTGSRLSDVLIGNEGANTLRGFDGNDELFGKAGDDSLVGDAGADILDGGEGNDRLIGGEGNDVFIVGKSRDGDEILDFEIGVDIIELAVPLAPENIKISVTDGDTQIISVKDDSLLTVVRNVTGSIEVRAARIDSPEQDLAGNSFNEARHISTATDGKEYLAWVGPNDLEDFYSITLGATNDIDITLKENTDNLQLQLIDINGNVVIEANTTDAEPLSISQRIEPGAYRVRIASIGERDSSYILSLAAKPEIPGAPGITTTGSESVNYLFTQESIPLVRVDDFRSGNTDLASRPEFQGIDGRGFSIVVIDSGVDLDHPFFGPDADGDGISDRIIIDNNADFDFADSDQDPSDTNDHGSNVASIAVSSDPLTPGVAPASNLIPLKVFPDGSRFASDADIEQALQWVVSNVERFNIAAVNMSLGSDNITQAQVQNGLPVRITGGIDDEIAELVARGVIVASASGNGYSPFSVQGVAYPSADPNSLSVGAVWDRLNINLTGGTSWGPRFVGAIDNTTGADRITSYSQRDGNLSDIFAPGSVITGANATGGTVSGEGTSLATPHISGMAVLAQQLAQQECGFQLTQNDFRQRLRNSAIPIFDGDENGDGVVNGDEEDDNVPNTRLTFLRADMLNLANDIMQCDTRQTKVDLSAKQFNVVSSTVNTGENVTLNFEIQNTGLDDSEAFEVSFFLSENDNITQRDRLLGKYPVNRLKANSSTGNISTTFTLPDIMSPIWKAFEDGSGYIGIRVDSANQILETNENNNSNSDIKRDLERIVIQPKASVFITLNEFKGDFDDDTFGLFGPTNKSDFLGRTTINGKTWATKEYESNNNPKPNITYIRNVDSISIPIRVRLFDVDGKITCDELQRIKDLKMNLNLFTGELSGDVTRDLKNLQGARNAVINDFSEIKFTIGLDVPSDNETPDAPPILTGGGC